jgi:hypothetical protein
MANKDQHRRDIALLAFTTRATTILLVKAAKSKHSASLLNAARTGQDRTREGRGNVDAGRMMACDNEVGSTCCR